MEILRLRIEKQGRAGKTATLIEGFTREKQLMAALVSELKRKLGTGGSFAGGTVILQGDVRVRLRPLLTGQGFTVRG
jgi:translation initiation factor 1